MAMENSFEEYQKDIYQVEHKPDMGYEKGFRAIKQILASLKERNKKKAIKEEEIDETIAKHTHNLLNRTCPDWLHGEKYAANNPC
jgi:hypothetical protein